MKMLMNSRRCIVLGGDLMPTRLMIASSTIRALQRANEIESSFLASVIQLFLKAIGDRNPDPSGGALV